MSNHSKALIPLESWCYHSPELLHKGTQIDIGLMAEALIYYDQILINPVNQPQFSLLLSWFIRQGKFSDLLALFNDETIKVYDYSFASSAIEKDGVYILMNIQDEIQKEHNTFERRFLYHDSIERCIPSARNRERLYKALSGKVIEAKADNFGSAIKNARNDYKDPERSAILIQAFIDEIYPLLNLGKPPEIKAIINKEGKFTRTTWNIDILEISKLLGKNLNMHLGIPLTAIANCNRFLQTSADLNCDLYLGKPMSSLVGDKLYEVGYKTIKSKKIIDRLEAEVEFPDIRKLVNEGKLNFDDILTIRKKAQKFRNWLQQEGDRDRNAIIAYHHEISKDAGLAKLGKKSLQIISLLAAPTIGATVGGAIEGTKGAILGSVAGNVVDYIFDLGAKMSTGWRPIVFGNWINTYIEKVVKKNNNIS